MTKFSVCLFTGLGLEKLTIKKMNFERHNCQQSTRFIPPTDDCLLFTMFLLLWRMKGMFCNYIWMTSKLYIISPQNWKYNYVLKDICLLSDIFLSKHMFISTPVTVQDKSASASTLAFIYPRRNLFAPLLNTLRPGQMAAIFQTTFWNAFSWMKMYEFHVRFHWSLFLKVQLTIFQYWFR